MCGIVGLYLLNRLACKGDVHAMANCIIHRGPDGEGLYADGHFAMGMRRLSIIDLTGGWQPIPNEDGQIQVVQNGEIYNHHQLRQELESHGHVFRTDSDTEAIVHAYEQWGGWEFAKHLRGMYTTAVWDSRKRQLWIARDRLGIKPCYYAHTDQGFGFASEIKSLLASPIVRAEINPTALADYLAFSTAGPENSFIRHVRQLLPGHVLCYQEDRYDIRSYWEFQFPERPNQLTVAEACEQLRQRLDETVTTHLLSDVPVGAFLSGGIDSSAMVGLMAQHNRQPVKTFSIGFDEQEFNELPYAELVARKWNTEHHFEIVRPDAVSILDKLIYHFDEPFADPSAIPTWYLSRLAAQHVKVAISGDGGDELFAGYTRYHQADRHRAVDHWPMWLRKIIAVVGRRLPDATPGKYFSVYAARDAAGRYAWDLDLFPGALRADVLRPEFYPDALHYADPHQQRLSTMAGARAHDLMSACMYLDVHHYLPMDILTKVDRMTMAHSLEARPPLLDHEFVEFVAGIPIQLKYAPNGDQKHLFKQAVKPLLPPELLQRPKAGFAVPLRQWFQGPLASLFRDLVLDRGQSLNYLQPRVVTRIFDENLSGRRDHGVRLWSVLVLEQWLRSLPSSTTPTIHETATCHP
ncbi:MAG: asparagine synthase (glutamine-hydrolyzing) [Pirellulales bacterium]